MIKYRSIGTASILIAGLILSCSQNPTKTTDDGNGTPTVGFSVTGKILGKDGKGIAGARATLLESGLSAVTDVQGVYSIVGQGTLHKALAKSLASDSTDTLVVLVPNEQGGADSSEVIKQVVTSGIIMELPSTYIVQREIRGYLLPDDAKQISKIEAVLFDVAVPEQQKHIDLWHDTLNKAFHSFAYFSSATNKSYTLYVNVYDTADHFVGRSPDFTFPDQAGNIVFANAFSWSNAKPTINIVAPIIMAGKDSVSFSVTASDSFGGKITSCKFVDGSGNSINITSSLAKRMGNDSVNVVSRTVTVPTSLFADSLSTTVMAIDNDGNVTTQKVVAKRPVIFTNQDCQTALWIFLDTTRLDVEDFYSFSKGDTANLTFTLNASYTNDAGSTVIYNSSSLSSSTWIVSWFIDGSKIGDGKTSQWVMPLDVSSHIVSIKVEIDNVVFNRQVTITAQ